MGASTRQTAAHVLMDAHADDARTSAVLLRQVEGHTAPVTADGAHGGNPIYASVIASPRPVAILPRPRR